MLGRSELLRTAAIVVLIAVFIVTLAAINRRPPAPVAEDSATATSPASDDLSTELRRCDAVSPTSAEEAHCEAVWEENRRRFLGRPARPLPPRSPSGTAAPATSSQGDAR